MTVHRTIKIFLKLLLIHGLIQTGTGQGDSETTSDGSRLGSNYNPKTAVYVVIFVGVFFLAGSLSIYIQRCCTLRDPSLLNNGGGVTTGGFMEFPRVARGLDAAVIEGFPSFRYSDVKGVKIGKGELECAVCLNEFADDEMLRLIPKCSHVFHVDCIGAWLSFHSTCPVCRADLVPKSGELLSYTGIQIPNQMTNTRTIQHDREADMRNPDVQRRDLESLDMNPTNQNTLLKSKSSGWWPARLCHRSHSTGHSMLQKFVDHERFTLILPEEIRKQLINNRLVRPTSYTALPLVKSSKVWYRNESVDYGDNYFYYERTNGQGQLERRPFSMTPPLFTRKNDWVRSPGLNTGECNDQAVLKGGTRSVVSPFDRVFTRNENGGEGSSRL